MITGFGISLCTLLACASTAFAANCLHNGTANSPGDRKCMVGQYVVCSNEGKWEPETGSGGQCPNVKLIKIRYATGVDRGAHHFTTDLTSKVAGICDGDERCGFTPLNDIWKPANINHDLKISYI
jgi:hypothetical protein